MTDDTLATRLEAGDLSTRAEPSDVAMPLTYALVGAVARGPRRHRRGSVLRAALLAAVVHDLTRAGVLEPCVGRRDQSRWRAARPVADRDDALLSAVLDLTARGECSLRRLLRSRAVSRAVRALPAEPVHDGADDADGEPLLLAARGLLVGEAADDGDDARELVALLFVVRRTGVLAVPPLRPRAARRRAGQIAADSRLATAVTDALALDRLPSRRRVGHQPEAMPAVDAPDGRAEETHEGSVTHAEG